MKGVDIEDQTWSRGTELSLDRDQGHEHLQRQEGDYVVPWVLHSDGANLSCMVPKTKGASRHMHLISEMHLTEELRGGYSRRICHSVIIRVVMKKAVCNGDCAGEGTEVQDPDNSAPISMKSRDFGATRRRTVLELCFVRV
ncbi:hypothetical protein B296_00033859 [Ensete ventricosum]|uniref:Uncharacterized protein n=1 Tax=Ensete ventricosum TaxID=4639 RepID=A0A426Z9V8_ENSVE|nr:hypothetical protein B296_00033859 [Ensete ventricosum]